MSARFLLLFRLRCYAASADRQEEENAVGPTVTMLPPPDPPSRCRASADRPPHNPPSPRLRRTRWEVKLSLHFTVRGGPPPGSGSQSSAGSSSPFSAFAATQLRRTGRRR